MTILVLAGSYEARKLLEKIKDDNVIASLAGATKTPAILPVKTRIGGFGGPSGFADYIQQQNITAVIDATHPFAENITKTATDVCANLSVPHVILQRPGWTPQTGDKWYFINTENETEKLIPMGSTVFLGTGRQTLQQFSILAGRKILARVIDPPTADFPFENGAYLVGMPPFSIQEEIQLFKDKGIDWLVVKNSGGDTSRSKLDAARALGLSVALLKRPKLPKAIVMDNTDDVYQWIKSL